MTKRVVPDEDDLLAAVDALTKKDVEHLAQRTDSGKWIRTHTVEHPPLLQRMHDAVRPSSNTTAGSASSLSTRSPADLDALFEFAKMEAQIWDWCHMLRITVTRNAVTDLRAWYAAHLAEVGADDGFYRRKLRQWARIIRKHLDPPKSFVIDGACPVCGTDEWGNMFDGGGLHPILVEYRVDEATLLTKDHTALCRKCRTVWDGYDAVIELGDELRDTRARRVAEDGAAVG